MRSSARAQRDEADSRWSQERDLGLVDSCLSGAFACRHDVFPPAFYGCQVSSVTDGGKQCQPPDEMWYPPWQPPAALLTPQGHCRGH